MFVNLLIALICLIGFVYSILKESIYAKLANGFMVLGIGLLLPVMIAKVKIENYVGFSVFIFFVGAIGLLILNLREKNTGGLQKALILFLALFGISPWFFKIMHWPGLVHLVLSFLPLLFLIIAVVNRKIKAEQMLSGIIVFGSFCIINFGQLIFNLLLAK